LDRLLPKPGNDAAARTWYHGSHHRFDQFKTTSKGGVTREIAEQPIFLTPDLGFARAHAGFHGWVYTVRADVSNTFDGDTLLDYSQRYYLDPKTYPALGKKVYDAICADEIWPDGSEDPEGYMKALAQRNWDATQSPEFVRWMKANGYDSFLETGEGHVNLGVFDPSKLEILAVVPAEETKKSASALDHDIRESKECGVFAVALGLLNPGAKVYALSNPDGKAWDDGIPYEITHAFCRVPGQGDFDVKGKRTLDEMAHDFGMAPGQYDLKGPWLPEEFRRDFIGNHERFPLYGTMREIRSMMKEIKKSGRFPVGESKTASVITPGQASRIGYHITPARNLKRIMTEGLVPKQGPRSRALGEPLGAIYLFRDVEAVETALDNWLGEQFGEETRLALLKVSVPSDAQLLKTTADYELVVGTTIPPSNISVVTRDVDAGIPKEASTTESKESLQYGITRRPNGFDLAAFDMDSDDEDGIPRVGLLQIDYRNPGSATVMAVDVKGNYQRQGIALKLYQMAKKELKARGVHLLRGALEGSGPLQIREKVFGPGNTRYLIGGEEVPVAKAKKIMDVDYGRLLAETKIAAVKTPGAPVTGSPAFKAWFSGSQIVDAEGNVGTFDPESNKVTAAVEAPAESTTRLYYHGTTWAAAEKIAQEGIKAGHGKNPRYPKKYVWCTTLPGFAYEYGKSISWHELDKPGESAVVTFEWAGESQPDPEHKKQGDCYRRIEADIPRSAIKSIKWFENGKAVKTAATAPAAPPEREVAKPQSAGPVTDTSAFITWFNGSQIVDSEGNPLPVIHGTDAEFDTFDRAKSQSGPSKFGFWFTTDPNLSELFGKNQMEVYLRMRRPYKITSSRWNEIRDLHAKDTAWFERWRENLKSKGFDGLWVAGEKFISSSGIDLSDPSVFAVFEPNQIKSVNNSGKFDENRHSVYASLPKIDSDAEWAKKGLERARDWIADEAKHGAVSDDQFARLISAALDYAVEVRYQGTPATVVASGTLKFRVGGAYNAMGTGTDPILLKLSPGLGSYLGDAAANGTSWWDDFVKQATGVLVHERTHALQFDRWRTDKGKKDPSGQAYEKTLEKFDKGYHTPQSEQASPYGDVTKYLGNEVEIAAFARQAVHDFRESGMEDREVYIWIRRKGGWDILSRKSNAFQSYYRIYLFNPTVGAPIFRKFLTNVVRALKEDETAPISREDFELGEELAPSHFSDKPNRWNLNRRKGPKAAAFDDDGTPKTKYDKVCYEIANDDDLWNLITSYVQHPDILSESPLTDKLVALIKTVPTLTPNPWAADPEDKCLYRGEPYYSGADSYYHDGKAVWTGSHFPLLSWSANYKTAAGFADGPNGIVWKTVGKVQGVALESLVTWRMRVRQGESHYSGMQAEWFVLSNCKAVEARRPQHYASKQAELKQPPTPISELELRITNDGPMFDLVAELRNEPAEIRHVGGCSVYRTRYDGQKAFRLRYIGVDSKWRGTGLGQILYDKAIAEAKKRGAKFFLSDDQRQPTDERAWDHLKQRYPVSFDERLNRYVIPLDATQKRANAPAKVSYGTVQADLPEDSAANEAIEEVRDQIDVTDLAGMGARVGKNHVTVRYGVKFEDTSAIEAYLGTVPPMQAKLGSTASFPPSESSDNAAVIIAPVECPELFEVNDYLGRQGDRTNGHWFTEPNFDYKPHCTIAYVKPGAEAKYVGLDTTKGKSFTIREVTVITPSKERKVITLNGTIAKTADGPTQDQDWMGQPGDITETQAFKAWFAGSKVVDDHRRPLRVYHGTNAYFDTFDPDKGERASDSPVDNIAGVSWFASNPEVATYFGGWRDGARLMPVYLALKDPRIVDLAKMPDEFRGEYFNLRNKTVYDIRYVKGREIESAKKQGNDGVIFENGYDGTPASGNIYAVFSANQIKSAIGNNGDFNPEKASITASKNKIYYHSTGVADVIRREGFRPSVGGELGPGVYVSEQPMHPHFKKHENHQILSLSIGDVRLLTINAESPNTPLAILEKLYGRKKGAEFYDTHRAEIWSDPRGEPNWAFLDRIIQETGFGGIKAEGSITPRNIVIFDPKQVHVLDVPSIESPASEPKLAASKKAGRRLGEIFAIATTETLPLTDPQKFDFFNSTDKGKVTSLSKSLEEGRELSPILVAKRRNGHYLVLDGNHRLQAALNAKKAEIEAYVVTWADLKKVLNAYFDGEIPPEASELDDYILLNDENLEPYSKRAHIAAEQVNWRPILTELMAVLQPGLETPEVKIVNRPSAGWLGCDVWKFGQQQNGDPHGALNTTIELQKSIMSDENTVRRVLAHELAHHEDNLVNKWKELEEKGYKLFKIRQQYDFTKGHGPSWLAIAARFNAKYGEGFVTPHSDESYVVDESVIKPFFVLMHRYVNGKLMWAHASRLSPKMEKRITEIVEHKNPGSYRYKLFKTNDRFYLKSPTIGLSGSAYPQNEEQTAKVEKLWEEGEDIIGRYAPSSKVAAKKEPHEVPKTQYLSENQPCSVSMDLYGKLRGARNGQIIGTLGDFLQGKALRDLYRKALNVPIMALNKAVENGRVVDNKDYIFHGALGSYQGKMTIFMNPQSQDQMTTILEEGAHACRVSLGRQDPKQNFETITQEEHDSITGEQTAAKMVQHALELIKKHPTWDHASAMFKAIDKGIEPYAGWENDYPQLVTYRKKKQESPDGVVENLHPDADKTASIPNQLHIPDRPLTQEYDAIRRVYQWYGDNNVDSLPWARFQKQFQQIAQKYTPLLNEIRHNRPVVTREDLAQWLESYHETAAPDYEVSFDRYHAGENSFRDVEQLVLQINQGANAESILAEDPVLEQYVDMVRQSSTMSGHPSGDKTVGWLRVDFVNEHYLLVDEVQTDLVNSVTQAKAIVESRTFAEFMEKVQSEKIREAIREKGIDAARFTQVRRSFIAQGYTAEKLDEIKDKLTHLFKDWASHALSTLLEIARRHGIKHVALHTVDSIAARDQAVEPGKVKMYYDNLAKSFGFKQQDLNAGPLKGKFWVRTASHLPEDDVRRIADKSPEYGEEGAKMAASKEISAQLRAIDKVNPEFGEKIAAALNASPWKRYYTFSVETLADGTYLMVDKRFRQSDMLGIVNWMSGFSAGLAAK
jgi:GNAT superfamily N-acetyltransferase/uncharacterized ParB-like nuclease family protein/2'-5' RNA ligase